MSGGVPLQFFRYSLARSRTSAVNSSICFVAGFHTPCSTGRVPSAICEQVVLEYSLVMGKWLEIAQKMAQAARAGLAIERKRLKEILAERQQKQVSSPSQSSR